MHRKLPPLYFFFFFFFFQNGGYALQSRFSAIFCKGNNFCHFILLLALQANSVKGIISKRKEGVVGWCKGVMYLMSPGHPTDIGSQLGKACYPCSR